MNHHLQLSAIAALLLLPAVPSRADQTNLVQTLTIRLAGISQGDTQTSRNVVTTSVKNARVNTGEVIKQLGTATGNSFSTSARLALVTPLGGAGSASIVVRDQGSSVDVTSFFVYETKSATLTSSQSNLRTGRGDSTEYSIQHLALVDSASYAPLTLHLDLQGVAVQSTSTGPNGSQTELDASVSGWGDENGSAVLLEGSFSLEGNTLEVVSSAPPPNV